MKVIGAGFARTGTSTLTQALEILGFGPCYHMFEVISRPDRVRQWLAAADGKPDWDEIFSGFRSAVDWPVAAYWKELAGRYPDAKIILTVRDPRRWYDSAAGTIFQFRLRSEKYPGKAILKVLTLANPDFADFIQMTDAIVWQGVLDGRFADRPYAISVFERHLDDVQKHIPADRLLVYDVAKGWGPLCDFLGVPVPAETPSRTPTTRGVPALLAQANGAPDNPPRPCRSRSTSFRTEFSHPPISQGSSLRVPGSGWC